MPLNQRHLLRPFRRARGGLAARAGFTMVEVMIASALLGFSLIVMFGFHSQALRSNMNARRLTECTYLAQTQMERLLALDWTATASAGDMSDGGMDASTVGMWDDLEWSVGAPVNAVNSTGETDTLPALYSVTWDITTMDDDATWVRMRVRCTYEDAQFSTRHGTTISSYRYRDAS
jgi:prepilin-type N-terminal cleavage/methylation domain-containing protein